MATIGLKLPQIADYRFEGSTIAYENHAVLAKAIGFEASIESSDDNSLYADDEIAETDKSFEGGSIKITTDDLSQKMSERILGLTSKSVTVNGTSISENVYDNDSLPPELGFAIMIPKKKNGKRKIRVIILSRIVFNIPKDAAKTREGKIEWQTEEIEGTIMRGQDSKGTWKREATVDDESIAQAYIDSILGGLDGTNSD